MLDNEITIEKMKTGLSKIRNKGIASAFAYMNVVEAWGSGIPKMFREATQYGLREPELIDLGSDFRVNLYRKAATVDSNGVINPKNVAQSGNPAQSGIATLPDSELAVVRYIYENKKCTTAQVVSLLDVKDRRARGILKSLVEKEILTTSGKARNTIYIAGLKFPDKI